MSARACGRAAVRLGHCTALHQTGQTDRRAAAELALRDADAKIGARRGHISQLILVLFTSRTYTVCWRQAGLSVCRGPGFRLSDSHTTVPPSEVRATIELCVRARESVGFQDMLKCLYLDR